MYQANNWALMSRWLAPNEGYHSYTICRKRPKSLVWHCESWLRHCPVIVCTFTFTDRADDEWEHGLTYRIVMELMCPYLNKNHMVYFDNFYSSPKLIKDLMQAEIYSCGTIRTDRGWFQDDFKNDKIGVGDSSFMKKVSLPHIVKIKVMCILSPQFIVMNVLKCQR